MTYLNKDSISEGNTRGMMNGNPFGTGESSKRTSKNNQLFIVQ